MTIYILVHENRAPNFGGSAFDYAGHDDFHIDFCGDDLVLETRPTPARLVSGWVLYVVLELRVAQVW